MDKPIPCPFCGSEARHNNVWMDGKFFPQILCIRCGARGMPQRSKAEAVAVWNRRYVKTCKWTEDIDGDGEVSWDTECKQKFCFIEGGPKDNKMNFCCYCGGELIESEVEQ